MKFMTTFTLATAVAALTLGLAPIQTAKASDYKMHAGSECKVFGSTAWTDLQFGARGITNISGTPKNIICPLTKDDDNEWDGGANTAQMHFHVITGSNPQTTTCNVYVVESDSTLVNTYSVTAGGIPNAEANSGVSGFTNTGDPDGGSHTHATMLCTLPAGAKLVYYYLFEAGDTN